jgi:hypothetical protein
MQPPGVPVSQCLSNVRRHCPQYVRSSKSPVATIPAPFSTRQTTRSGVAPAPPVSRPTTKLEHVAWHDAVNARILHTHTRYLRRGLFDCTLGPCHSRIRARNICLGPRSRRKSCKRRGAAVGALLARSRTCRASRGAGDAPGQSWPANWLYRHQLTVAASSHLRQRHFCTRAAQTSRVVLAGYRMEIWANTWG